VRVPTGTLLTNWRLRVDEIEKHERFDHLADVGGADHANNRTMRVATRAENDAATCPDIGGGLSEDDGTHWTLSNYLSGYFKYLACHFGDLENGRPLRKQVGGLNAKH
jgi:hypothetical protein